MLQLALTDETTPNALLSSKLLATVKMFTEETTPKLTALPELTLTISHKLTFYKGISLV